MIGLGAARHLPEVGTGMRRRFLMSSFLVTVTALAAGALTSVAASADDAPVYEGSVLCQKFNSGLYSGDLNGLLDFGGSFDDGRATPGEKFQLTASAIEGTAPNPFVTYAALTIGPPTFEPRSVASEIAPSLPYTFTFTAPDTEYGLTIRASARTVKFGPYTPIHWELSCDPDPPQDQTITFDQPEDVRVNGVGVNLVALASSGLPVTLTSLTPSTCSVDGDSARLLAVGVCTVEATQPGDDDFSPAPPVARSFNVLGTPQTITFDQPADMVVGGPGQLLAPTASSLLSVEVTTLTPTVCALDGYTVSPRSAGTCTLLATRPASGNFNAAPDVTRSLTVAKAPLALALKGSSSLVSLLTGRTTYSTTVRSRVTGLPVAGVPVTTKVAGGRPASGCTAITNAKGVATCTTGPGRIALGSTFVATVAEQGDYKAATTTVKQKWF